MDGNPAREYYLYLRKSKGRAGIPRQRARTTAHIERQGGTVADEFTDEDRTAFQHVGGARPDRPGFDALIAALAAAPGVSVGAYHADRLLRNPGDTETLIAACAAGRHLVETPSGGAYDLGTANGRRRLREDANSAAYEVDRLVERVTDQKKEQAASGRPLGGRRPFGYTADGMRLCHGEVTMLPAEAERRGLVPVREVMTRAGERVAVILPYDEAAELQGACERLLGGASLHSVARDWNTRGVLTASGYRWSGTEVRRVVSRARNSGDLEHNAAQPDGTVVTTITPAKWPAVISRGSRRLLCALLDDPARQAPGAERRHLGSGIYLCGACGATMLATTSTHPAGRLVYRCSATRKPGARSDGIAHAARDAHALDKYVLGAVRDWLEQEGNLDLLTRPQPGPDGNGDELDGIDADLEELAAEQAAGRLTVRQLVIASAPLQARRRQLEARREPARPDVARGRNVGQLLAAMGEDLDLSRTVLGMIYRVRVLPAPNGRPPGWRPGASYFSPQYVELTRKL